MGRKNNFEKNEMIMIDEEKSSTEKRECWEALVKKIRAIYSIFLAYGF